MPSAGAQREAESVGAPAAPAGLGPQGGGLSVVHTLGPRRRGTEAEVTPEKPGPLQPLCGGGNE